MVGQTVSKLRVPRQAGRGRMSRNWKLLKFFLVQARDITVKKIIQPQPNSNSLCVFSWYIYILFYNLKRPGMIEIMNGNWKLLEFV